MSDFPDTDAMYVQIMATLPTAFEAAIRFAIRKGAYELFVEGDDLTYYAMRHPCVKVRGYMRLDALQASNSKHVD